MTIRTERLVDADRPRERAHDYINGTYTSQVWVLSHFSLLIAALSRLM